MADHDAGPELDALVAQKVLGWTDIEEYRDGMRTIHPDVNPWWRGRAPEAPWHQPLPRFSTSLVAAWQILEWLAARFKYVDLGVELHSRWSVTVGNRGDEILYGADEATAPLSICVAALRAVEAQ